MCKTQGSRVRSPRLRVAEDGKSFKNEGAILITMFGAFLKSGGVTQLERKTGLQHRRRRVHWKL